nr:Fusicoccadiene synthase 3 [Colletotrichum truncatum]KAF6801877.1 Fusicoccadiene synthase 3 [Colletotrichum truncatum]
MPESLPERVASLAYFMDCIFFLDDFAEAMDQSDTEAVADDLVSSLKADTKASRHGNAGLKKVQAKIVLELLSIDRACGENIVTAWKEWALKGGNKLNKHHSFQTFHEYVDYRVIDSGAEVGVQLMNLGLAQPVSPLEMNTISHITRPAYVALCLANDYFSFEAEHAAFKMHPDADTMANGVFVLMKVEKLNVADAKNMLKKIINANEDKFLQLKKAEEAVLPPKLRLVLDGLVHMIVGNLCWSVVCPRYARKRDIKMLSCVADYGQEEVNGAKDGYRRQNDAGVNLVTPKSIVQLGNGPNTPAFNGTKGPKWSNGSRNVASVGWRDPKMVSGVECKQKLSKQFVSGPAEYTRSLPSKRVRENLIDALNGLDDIEDSSPLRRGEPAAHVVYGVPLAINSANYLYVLALESVSKLSNSECIRIFIEEVKNMEIGQSHDLYWTRTMQCPSVEEYLQMVDMKTGALFSLLARLLAAEAPKQRHVSFEGIVKVAGRYFQIRDDWNNLVCAKYEAQKGFCEDLDEGKYSFPMIHALQHSSDRDKVELQSMLCERQFRGGLTPELKRHVLRIMERSGSLEQTRLVLVHLQSSIQRELDELEALFETPNWMLRYAFEKLKIDLPAESTMH